jgi:UDP-2,3-diacylglucosamine hydrolase
MSSYFFFSDAHLGATARNDDKRRQKLVLDFLDHVRDHGAGLYIVGDLFDFWFEYRHVIPSGNFPVLAKLYELSRAGVPIDYLAGNHDLWLGAFLENQVGVRVHEEGIVREIFDMKCFIVHGDGIATQDRGYRLMKRIFKNKTNIALFRWLHPDLGVKLARALSYTSRQSREGHYTWEADYKAYAQARFAEGFDVVILGHTHKPLFEKIGASFFINLGDWMDHFTYCEIDSRGPSLRRWPTGDPVTAASTLRNQLTESHV